MMEDITHEIVKNCYMYQDKSYDTTLNVDFLLEGVFTSVHHTIHFTTITTLLYFDYFYYDKSDYYHNIKF